MVESRVVDHDEEPIHGLYATSNSAAHLVGLGYAGEAATIGPNVVSRFMAGENAAPIREASDSRASLEGVHECRKRLRHVLAEHVVGNVVVRSRLQVHDGERRPAVGSGLRERGRGFDRK